MHQFIDFEGRLITLSAGGREHAFEHVGVSENFHRFAEVLSNPDLYVQSSRDHRTWLYYKRYKDARGGEKYLCVAVKHLMGEAFIATAYITHKVKKGP